jgi:hypothetical protein
VLQLGATAVQTWLLPPLAQPHVAVNGLSMRFSHAGLVLLGLLLSASPLHAPAAPAASGFAHWSQRSCTSTCPSSLCKAASALECQLLQTQLPFTC